MRFLFLAPEMPLPAVTGSAVPARVWNATASIVEVHSQVGCAPSLRGLCRTFIA